MSLDRRSLLGAIAGLVPSTMVTTASAGGSSSASDDGGIVSDSDMEPASAAAAPAASLSGEVLTYEGKPIAGATVTFKSLDTPPKAFPDLAPVTGDGGRFTASLPAGRFRVSVMTPAGSRKSRDTVIEAGRMRAFRIWLPR